MLCQTDRLQVDYKMLQKNCYIPLNVLVVDNIFDILSAPAPFLQQSYS